MWRGGLRNYGFYLGFGWVSFIVVMGLGSPWLGKVFYFFVSFWELRCRWGADELDPLGCGQGEGI